MLNKPHMVHFFFHLKTGTPLNQSISAVRLPWKPEAFNKAGPNLTGLCAPTTNMFLQARKECP